MFVELFQNLEYVYEYYRHTNENWFTCFAFQSSFPRPFNWNTYNDQYFCSIYMIPLVFSLTKIWRFALINNTKHSMKSSNFEYFLKRKND